MLLMKKTNWDLTDSKLSANFGFDSRSEDHMIESVFLSVMHWLTTFRGTRLLAGTDNGASSAYVRIFL